MNLRTRIYFGLDIEEIIPDLARLRIKVFYDYPYLYAGDFEYEKNYLKIYPQSHESVVVAVFDNDLMIGAASAIPLKDEADYVKLPFEKANLDIKKIYYFGESVLLKEYRGKGLGNVFFNEREKAALKFNYKTTAFCGVNRPSDHPLKPNEYKPLDEFWKKRGYIKQENLVSEFSWQDIGDNFETLKPMIYWMRELV